MFKGTFHYSVFYQARCFRILRCLVRAVPSMSISPLPHFFGCEMSSLVRSSTVCHTMTMDKTFCKSVDGSYGRSIEQREGKARECLFESGQNAAALIMEAVWNDQPATNQLAERLGSGAIRGQPQCWSLLLADWTFRGICCQVSLIDWKFMLLSSYVTSIPVTMATFSWTHWVTMRVADERGCLVSTEKVILSSRWVELLSAEAVLWWAFTWDIHLFPFCAHSEKSIHTHIPHPQILAPIFQSCSLQMSTQLNHWLKPMNPYFIICLTIFLFKKTAQPGGLPEVLSTGKISLHHCLSGVSQRGL